MPEIDILKEYERIININGFESPDESIIINLQQQYFVDYKAITRRLSELNIIDSKAENELNEIDDNKNALLTLTKKLGYSNELNEPSKTITLPRKNLKAVDENYKNKDTSFDDLIVLFSYL
jgi:hypothetical protein